MKLSWCEVIKFLVTEKNRVAVLFEVCVIVGIYFYLYKCYADY